MYCVREAMTHHEFSEIYELYKVMVFQIAYAYLQNVEDSEEAVLESFMRFKGAAHRLVTLDDKRRYLTRITINVAKDMLRKLKPVYVEDLHGVSEDKDELAISDLWQMVAKLDAKYKSVIILRYIEDLSYEEIAITLKIKVSLVRKQHERAIKMLREMSGEESEKD